MMTMMTMLTNDCEDDNINDDGDDDDGNDDAMMTRSDQNDKTLLNDEPNWPNPGIGSWVEIEFMLS